MPLLLQETGASPSNRPMISWIGLIPFMLARVTRTAKRTTGPLRLLLLRPLAFSILSLKGHSKLAIFAQLSLLDRPSRSYTCRKRSRPHHPPASRRQVLLPVANSAL